MLPVKLSTLAVLLGLGLGLPQIYGLINPKEFAAAVRKFPRSLTWGYTLTLLGTIWFLWNLSQESKADGRYRPAQIAGNALEPGNSNVGLRLRDWRDLVHRLTLAPSGFA